MAASGRPCKLRIQIEDGVIREMEDMGFHLMDSPDIIVPSQREYETEDYPEYDGVKIYPYTSYKSFDYTCKMLYVGDLESMNEKIRELWEMMFEQPEEGAVRRAREVTVMNDYKSVFVTGYAKDMPGEETFIEVRKGCWKFDFTLFVADPKKCVWNASMIKMGGSVKPTTVIFPNATFNEGYRVYANNGSAFCSVTNNLSAASGFSGAYQRATAASGATGKISVFNQFISGADSQKYRTWKMWTKIQYRSSISLVLDEAGGNMNLPPNMDKPKEVAIRYSPGIGTTFNIESVPASGAIFEVRTLAIVPLYNVTIKGDGIVIGTVETDEDGNYVMYWQIDEAAYNGIGQITVEAVVGNTSASQVLEKKPYTEALKYGYELNITM